MKISGLVKKVLLGGAVVASAVLPGKLQAQTPTWYQAFNPRNEVVDGFESYGMPDINKDRKFDWADYDLIDSNPSHQTDIDADYLNGIITYLPGEYWRSTPSEKDSWIRKVYPIITRLNNREFIPASDPRAQDQETRFDCTNGVIQDILSMNGYNPNRDDFGLIHSKYTLEYNGLFNLPAYFAGVHSDDGTLNHAVTAIFKGTNLNDLEGWLFLEPQTGKVVEPGKDWSIPYNSEIRIQGLHNFKDSNIIDEPMFYNAVKIDVDSQGNLELLSINPNMIEDQTSLGVENNENTNISDKYILKQNYPNPFNSSTIIQFDIPLNPPLKRGTMQSGGYVSLIIYDIIGKEITTLANNINTSGTYKVEWNASGYPSGIYFCQLQSNSAVIVTKKMLLMK